MYNGILNLTICLFLSLTLALGQPANAQENIPVDAEVAEAMPPSDSTMTPFSLFEEKDASPFAIQSLFFTPEALALLEDAIGGLITPDPDGDEKGKKPGIRELALGGIVYTGSDDWTIWLNGRRITPNAIPEQIFDLSVSREHIDIKWYDAYTNRLFPVRLKPNERFNLDSRLFLTGAHSPDQQL